MARHTTFRTGGAADIYVTPPDRATFLKVAAFICNEEWPLFVIGGGSNILVADKGIRGIVLSTSGLNDCTFTDAGVSLGAGTVISDMALKTASAGLGGLHSFYGMPGSTGGAVFMNARCYEKEISEIFISADIWYDGKVKSVGFQSEDWGYKKSPFQKGGVILGVDFQLQPDDPVKLKSEAESCLKDREVKGHFKAPCAGSVFKNNRSFGGPSGSIIDRCGLKGFSVGGAKVSDWHANIIVNEDGATSSDILALIRHVQKTVMDQTGFKLEPEVIPVGEWEDNDVTDS